MFLILTLSRAGGGAQHRVGPHHALVKDKKSRHRGDAHHGRELRGAIMRIFLITMAPRSGSSAR
jgi:hypothetical protein